MLLLGAVCLTNTAPAVQDGDTLNRAVMAAKYLYDALSAEQEVAVMMSPRCCRNCCRCPDESPWEFVDVLKSSTVLCVLAKLQQ